MTVGDTNVVQNTSFRRVSGAMCCVTSTSMNPSGDFREQSVGFMVLLLL